MGLFHGTGFENPLSGRNAAALVFPVVTAMLLMLPATSARSAYYHDLEKNRQPCADCHTLHYSESGAQPAKAEAGGPFAQLRIRSTTNKLCLFCHDGYDPKAPDVLDSVTMYNGSGDEHSGAGFFGNSGGTANENGHDLGLNSSSPPLSTMTNVTLTCASCHDPHGTLNFRNVLSTPAGGTGVSVEPAKDVFRDVPPGDPPSTAASIAAYKESNEGYQANTAKWCTECHDKLKTHVAATTRTENHHLVDVALNDPAFSSLATPPDPAHWVQGYTGDQSADNIDEGFDLVTGDSIEGVPRLRFQVAGATDYATSRTVAANNQVICGTCHLAHGGKYKKGLVWPNRESGSPVDQNSGCQQCHNM